MAEKLDITKAYNELKETIEKGDHNQSLSICNKILAQYPKEKEAIGSKIIALINLGKSEEAISFIKLNKCESEYHLEYAYALYDSKKFKESIDIINSGAKNESTNILLAQNYYKLSEYEKAYEIYKKLIEEKIKSEQIENESDLFTNYLACYALNINNKDENFLNGLKKYLSTWESCYNFCIIYLRNKDIENSFQLIKKIKEEYPKLEDEFNELKSIFMNVYNIQNIFEGFDLNKYSTINNKFEAFFKNLEKNQKDKDFIKMMPYFYVNFLNFRKDRDSNNEVIRKLESFLKNKDINLSKEEEKIIIKNKINFLIRSNKLKDAENLLNEIKDDKEYNIYQGLILYKNEKDKDKAIQKVKSEFKSNEPSDDLFIIQLMLTSLTSKSIDDFHKTVMEFIKKNKQFCLSEYFISFFIGLYNSKKNPNCLKEFIQEFNDIEELTKSIKNKNSLKNIILLIAETFYKSGEYEKSGKFYQYYLNTVNKDDKDIKFLLIQSLAHFNTKEADEIRRKIDETEIDLSNENINNLLNQLFSKFRKGGEKQEKTKKKKKRKIRYPKNFDPQHPGPMPDPERWLPKMQKKKYRAKNKLAHQGAIEETKK
jgi:signal recognition particle subunit SRP72